MLKTINAKNRQKYRDLLQAAYRLRHDVFVEELGWAALAKDDGLEVDEFDTDTAVEMVVEIGGQVVGYQRLLPTTGPYLLSHVYPHLCDGTPPSDPKIYEWTRFAVARSHRGDGRSLGPVALALVTSFVEWGLANNVSAMVVEMPPSQLLRFVSCHFRAFPLGLVHQVGRQEILAIQADFDARTLARLHQIRDMRGVVAGATKGNG